MPPVAPTDPVAVRDEDSSDYFDALARGTLTIRLCPACRHYNPPQTRSCSACHHDSLEWVPAAGQGTVVAAVVDRAATGNPRVLAFIELDEGPWIPARLLGTDAAVPAGTRVTLTVRFPADGAPGEPVPAFSVDTSPQPDPRVP